MTMKKFDFSAISPTRRSLLWLAAVIPAMLACAGAGSVRAAAAGKEGAGRFAGVPIGTLYLDAHPEKRAVTIYDDRGFSIGDGALLSLKVTKHYSFPGGERGLPATIRATWRSGAVSSNAMGEWTGGQIIGDYTVPVADRIPQAVLDYIRREGGSLRLKVRIVDAGVLLGWDVEQRIGSGGVTALVYRMAGGDFREDRIENGKVVEPGWEHAPSGTNNLTR